MRLIDADVLEIMFKRIGLSCVTNRIVDAAPTVYAVEVVRCKDCKNYSCEENEDCPPMWNQECCKAGRFDRFFDTTRFKPQYADWFCADGERREHDT